MRVRPLIFGSKLLALLLSLSSTLAAECDRNFAELAAGEELATAATTLTELEQQGVVQSIPLEAIPSGDWKKAMQSRRLWRQLMPEKGQGPTLTYVVDDDSRVYVSSAYLDFSREQPFIVRNTSAESEGASFIPKEAGTLSYDSDQKKLVFKSEYNLGSSDEEHQALAARLRASVPRNISVEAKPVAGMTQEEVLKCVHRAAQNTSRANFLATAVGVDALAQGGTMIMMGQFKTKKGRAIGSARLSWIGVMDMQMKMLDMYMISRTGGVLIPILLKVPLSYVDKTLNEKWNKFFLTHFGEKRPADGKAESSGKPSDDKTAHATAEANFEAGLLKMPVTTSVDLFLLKKLQALTMSLCQVNPKLSLAVNNQTVRVVERTAVGVGVSYYVTRRVSSETPEAPETQDRQAK